MNISTTLSDFLRFFIKKQSGYFIAILLLSFAWSLDNTVWPYAIKFMIDKILAFQGDKATLFSYLTPVFIFWGILWIGIDLMFRIQEFLMAYAMPRFTANIRMAMYKYVLSHSYDFFSSNLSGNVSNKISDMANSSARILLLILTLFTPALLTLIIASAVFFSLNALFMWILLAWSTIHITICIVSGRRCANLSDDHSASRSQLTGKIVDSFSNIANVKLFSKKHFEYDYVNRFQKDELKKHQRSQFEVAKTKLYLGALSIIFMGFLMTGYQIYCYQHGMITVGDLILLINTNWNITMIAWIINHELPTLFTEIGICQQAMSIIRAEHDIVDMPKAQPIKVKQGDIEFEDVTFNYVEENTVFKKMSVKIKAGSKVGLVGFSGSGKSTFINLIMRFFDVESGRILIDGQDISQVTIESLREQISMIPQDPTLFHRTLLENIRYGKTDATFEEVVEAAKHANCDEFIRKMPDGYDSLVGERGNKLSGGQRQRIAIARAILKNAPILILDEATSALDSITEKRIQEALHYLMQDKTTIIVAHRLSTLSAMDRIMVFDNGKIIEDGTHRKLLRQKGHYAKLWHMQAGGFIPDEVDDEDEDDDSEAE